MRINIIEKFELYHKLDSLSNQLKEHAESQNICKKAIHDLKTQFTNRKLNGYLGELKKYEWIGSIETFLNEFNSFVNENKYGIELENIVNNIQHVPTFQPVSDLMKEIMVLGESEIKSRMPELEAFKYEPHTRNLLEKFNKVEFNTQETETAKIISSNITPVMQIEEGTVFSTKSGNYLLSKDMTVINKYQGEVSKEFAYGKKALDLFKYKGDNTFVANLPKTQIKVIARTLEPNKIIINESEIPNKKALDTLLRKTGILSYNDVETRSIIEFMYERADSLVEVDFVKSVETVNENFEIFRLANNDVFISKYDNLTRGFIIEQIELEEIEQLNENLKGKYDLDFSNILEGLDINIDSLQFKTLVEGIDVSKLVDLQQVEDIKGMINEANDKYNSFSFFDRANVEKTYLKLQEKEKVVYSEKVRFILETKNALVDKLEDGKELNEALDMLNKELSQLVLVEGMEDFKKKGEVKLPNMEKPKKINIVKVLIDDATGEKSYLDNKGGVWSEKYVTFK